MARREGKGECILRKTMYVEQFFQNFQNFQNFLFQDLIRNDQILDESKYSVKVKVLTSSTPSDDQIVNTKKKMVSLCN